MNNQISNVPLYGNMVKLSIKDLSFLFKKIYKSYMKLYSLSHKTFFNYTDEPTELKLAPGPDAVSSKVKVNCPSLERNI